jgi:hypothetical protein
MSTTLNCHCRVCIGDRYGHGPCIEPETVVDAPAPMVYNDTVKPSLPEFVRGARVKRK